MHCQYGSFEQDSLALMHSIANGNLPIFTLPSQSPILLSLLEWSMHHAHPLDVIFLTSQSTLVWYTEDAGSSGPSCS